MHGVHGVPRTEQLCDIVRHMRCALARSQRSQAPGLSPSQWACGGKVWDDSGGRIGACFFFSLGPVGRGGGPTCPVSVVVARLWHATSTLLNRNRKPGLHSQVQKKGGSANNGNFLEATPLPAERPRKGIAPPHRRLCGTPMGTRGNAWSHSF